MFWLTAPRRNSLGLTGVSSLTSLNRTGASTTISVSMARRLAGFHPPSCNSSPSAIRSGGRAIVGPSSPRRATSSSRRTTCSAKSRCWHKLPTMNLSLKHFVNDGIFTRLTLHGYTASLLRMSQRNNVVMQKEWDLGLCLEKVQDRLPRKKEWQRKRRKNSLTPSSLHTPASSHGRTINSTTQGTS